MDGIRDDDLFTKVNELLRLVERLEVVWEEEKPTSSSSTTRITTDSTQSISSKRKRRRKPQAAPTRRRIHNQRRGGGGNKLRLQHTDAYHNSKSSLPETKTETLPQTPSQTRTTATTTTATNNYNSSVSTRPRHTNSTSTTLDGWMLDDDDDDEGAEGDDESKGESEDEVAVVTTSPPLYTVTGDDVQVSDDESDEDLRDQIGEGDEDTDTEFDQVEEHHFIAQQEWINALKMSFSVDKALTELGSLNYRTENLSNRRIVEQITQRLEKLKSSVGIAVEFCSSRLEKIEIEQKLKNLPSYLQMPTVEIKLDAPVSTTTDVSPMIMTSVLPKTNLTNAEDEESEYNIRQQSTNAIKQMESEGDNKSDSRRASTTVVDSTDVQSQSQSQTKSISSLLKYHRETQETLTNELAQMSHQLKLNSLNFSKSLESDKSYLQETEAILEKNLEKTKLQGSRLKTYSKTSSSTTCFALLAVLGVSMAWMFMFFIIRFT